VWADVNQTEQGDDVAGLKGSNVNHNLPNSEPGAAAADVPAAAVSARPSPTRPDGRSVGRLQLAGQQQPPASVPAAEENAPDASAYMSP